MLVSLCYLLLNYWWPFSSSFLLIFIFIFISIFPHAGIFSVFLLGDLAGNEGCQPQNFPLISSRSQVRCFKLGRGYRSWMSGQILWSRLRQKNFMFPRSPFSVMLYSATFVYIYLVWQLIVVLSIEANRNGRISLPKEVFSFLRLLVMLLIGVKLILVLRDGPTVIGGYMLHLIMGVMASCFCPAANHLWLLLFPILKQFEEDRYGQFVANNLPISSSKKRNLNEQTVACRNVKMAEMPDLVLILQYIIRFFFIYWCGCIICMKLPSFVCMQKPSSHPLWFTEIWIFIHLIGHKTQCFKSETKSKVGS